MAAVKAQARKKPPAKGGRPASKTPKGSKAAKPPAAKPARAATALKVVKGAAKPVAKRSAPRTPELKVVKPAPVPAQQPLPRLVPQPQAKGALVLDRLHQVALVATDLDAAVRFYGEVLALPFIARFDPPGLAFFDLGNGLRLMLSATASAATFYFYVKNLEAAVAALQKRGVSFLHKPSMIHRDDAGQFGKKGGEEWMAFFKDPSGNMLALVTRK